MVEVLTYDRFIC